MPATHAMCPIALADPLFSGAHVQVFKHYEHYREDFYPAARRRKIEALKKETIA